MNPNFADGLSQPQSISVFTYPQSAMTGLSQDSSILDKTLTLRCLGSYTHSLTMDWR